MARGELLKKLLGSYGREDEFRTTAEQIILEEENKKNVILAKTLRRALDGSVSNHAPIKGLTPLLPISDPASEFIERIEPSATHKDISLSTDNVRVFQGLLKEYRCGEEIRKRGLPVRSKLLFCGPPGCGKTLCAEVFASELGLPLYVVKLDKLISSYLGETATNIRKIFEFARKRPCVLFLDEFDALARSRGDSSEHNELRRVVNSLLLYIDRMQPRGFMVAATNLDKSLDSAIWRRFDEVLWFEKPTAPLIAHYLKLKFKNTPTDFSLLEHAASFDGFSYAEIERVCVMAMKWAIINDHKRVLEADFSLALSDELRRRAQGAREGT